MLTLALLHPSLCCFLIPGFQQAAQEPPPAAQAVLYRIRLLEPETPRVAIELELAGEADGETRIGVAPEDQLPERGKDLVLEAARLASGEALEPLALGQGCWSLRHPPGAALELRFVVGPTGYRASARSPTYYLPILEPRLLHWLGTNVLPAPLDEDGGAERELRLEWLGFAEAGWRTCSSFEPSGRDAARRVTLDGFRHGLFLAGDLRVEERFPLGSPLHVAVFGEDWGTPLADFADLCAQIVEIERGFFGEEERPRYLISLLPIGERNPRSFSMGGTGLEDSFALFLPPGSVLDGAPSRGMSIPWLLAHEMFHEWNGHAIRLAQPERLGYWFSEGFTDFYARRLLHRDGLIDDEEYLRSWNRRFQEQHANPWRNAPATRIDEAFWSDRDVGSLPYQRGDLVALLVDRAIARASAGERCLDDLMRSLVAQSRAGQGPFSVDALLGQIAAVTDEATAERVRAIVVDGAEIELGPDFDLPGHGLRATEAGYRVE